MLVLQLKMLFSSRGFMRRELTNESRQGVKRSVPSSNFNLEDLKLAKVLHVSIAIVSKIYS